MVLELIRNVKARGVPVILISHNLPHVFEIADRIQVMRLGRRAGIARPGEQSMDGVVAMMTGATQAELATAVAAADQTASQAEPA
jgi:fructose transport system ATP-binding protein